MLTEKRVEKALLFFHELKEEFPTQSNTMLLQKAIQQHDLSPKESSALLRAFSQEAAGKGPNSAHT